MLGRRASRSGRAWGEADPHGAAARQRRLRGVLSPAARRSIRTTFEGSADRLSGLARVTIAILAGLIGWMIARFVAHLTPSEDDLVEWGGAIALAVIAYFVGPQIGGVLDRAASIVESSLGGMSAYEALSGAIGLLIGLIIAYSVRGAYLDLHMFDRYGP